MTTASDVELGRRMHARGLVLRGHLSVLRWQRFLVEAAERIGMAPVDRAKVWRYPVDGKGGNGTTIVQPITESFLALDTWPDHDGAYLFVCSCRAFDVAKVVDVATDYHLRCSDMSAPVNLALES